MNLLDVEPWLTTHPDKRRLYPDDVYLREALADYRRLRITARHALEQVTYLLVKPEAMVERSGTKILSFLGTHGYDAVGARLVHLDRLASRDLWRYQFNAAPLSVLHALDVLLGTAPAICLAIVDPSASPTAPAAARLAAQKGSYIRGIPSGSLRDVLGSPTLILSFVHTPDDPADVLRELGVLLGAPDREQFLAMALGCRSAAAEEGPEAVLETAYGYHPRGEIDLAASFGRIQRAIDIAATDAGERRIVRDVAEALRRPPDDEALLLALVDWLSGAPATVALWDRAVVAAFLVGHQRLERPPLVGP